jgi:hypothetical protein
VFLFDGTSALCGNSPHKVSDFVDYDWIGAAWKWAKPGTPHEFGGNGALSIRSRDLMLTVLHHFMESEEGKTTSSSTGTDGSSNSKKVLNHHNESRHAVFKGNEDMWYVKKIFEYIEKGIIKATSAKLAPKNVSMTFAVEELYDDKLPFPCGVYHTMRSMTDKLREKVLNECPEAKRLFSAKHENGK